MLPLEPVELPLELPEPMPPLEPEPLVLGEGLELGDGVELVPPLAAPEPLAPEPDLLKCASHSARDTWPSLLVSTEEKLGAEELLLEPDVPLEPLEPLEPPEAALPPVDDEPDEPLALPEVPELLLPDAAGEDDDEDGDADLSLLEDEELCATATLDSANSAAAVAALRTLSFNIDEPPEMVGEKPALRTMKATCRPAFSRRKLYAPWISMRRGLACSAF